MLTTNRIDVHYLLDIPNLTEQQHNIALQCLDDDENARYRRIHRPLQQAVFLATRYACKTILSEYLDCDTNQIRFRYSKNGKPFLIGANQLSFSLSHTGNNMAIAVSGVNVGVDLESFSSLDKLLENPELYLNEKAKAQMCSSGSLAAKQQLAARYWTALEAIVKLKDCSVFKQRKTLKLVNRIDAFPCDYVLTGLSASTHVLANDILVTAIADNPECVFRYLPIKAFA